jgi:hypothetical protein
MALLKNVESKIFRVEGFSVTIRHSDGRDMRGDRDSIPTYSYDRMAKNTMSVAEWKSTRFQPAYPGFAVDVLSSSGRSVNGRTKLSTVRGNAVAPVTKSSTKTAKIFTVGCENLTPARLREIVTGLSITVLMDCRTVPSSRPAGFSKSNLQEAFNDVYRWEGERLGIRSKGSSGVKWFAKFATTTAGNILLLCKEEAPGSCHLHYKIALPLLHQKDMDILHICDDEVILASELHRAIDEDNEYTYENLAV